MVIFGYFWSSFAPEIIIDNQHVTHNSAWVLELTNLNIQWVFQGVSKRKIAKNGEKMHFLSFRALLDPFFHNFPNRCFSNMQGEVLRGSKKPTSIVAMLMHFFRVTTVKEGCVFPPSSQGRSCMPQGPGPIAGAGSPFLAPWLIVLLNDINYKIILFYLNAHEVFNMNFC